jgi:hypothetical protein
MNCTFLLSPVGKKKKKETHKQKTFPVLISFFYFHFINRGIRFHYADLEHF